MPIATSPSTAPRPFKMEERKRPAITNADDLAPPSKRQNVNGAGKSRDDSGDAKDEAWIEVSVTRPSRPPPPDPLEQKHCRIRPPPEDAATHPSVGTRRPVARFVSRTLALGFNANARLCWRQRARVSGSSFSSLPLCHITPPPCANVASYTDHCATLERRYAC